MPDIVKMVKDGKEVKVVKSAFEAVWKDKGWRLKGEKTPPPPKPVEKPELEKKSFPESATS